MDNEFYRPSFYWWGNKHTAVALSVFDGLVAAIDYYAMKTQDSVLFGAFAVGLTVFAVGITLYAIVTAD